MLKEAFIGLFYKMLILLRSLYWIHKVAIFSYCRFFPFNFQNAASLNLRITKSCSVRQTEQKGELPVSSICSDTGSHSLPNGFGYFLYDRHTCAAKAADNRCDVYTCGNGGREYHKQSGLRRYRDSKTRHNTA